VDDEVSELRLVVTTPDYDTALAFYRDTLGLREQAAFSSPDGRVTILAAGRATLELTDPGNAAFIDDVEVGRRVAGPIRVAFEVTDSVAVTDRLARAGAQVVAPPTRTPWGTVNARLDAPGDLHLTLFSHPAGEPARRDEQEIMVGRVGAPDPAWPDVAAALVGDVQRALGDRVLLLEHAGSTSVPGLAARPVIDLVLAVRDPADEQSYVGPLERLGYQLEVREPDRHEHRMLKLAEPSVNLHVFGLGAAEIDRMLAFRGEPRPLTGIHVALAHDDPRAESLADRLAVPLLDVAAVRAAGVDAQIAPLVVAAVANGCPASVLVGDVPTGGLAGRVLRDTDLLPRDVDALARAVRQLAAYSTG
jgi:predicted enzyme related to lactoylglutathione lyase